MWYIWLTEHILADWCAGGKYVQEVPVLCHHQSLRASENNTFGMSVIYAELLVCDTVLAEATTSSSLT